MADLLRWICERVGHRPQDLDEMDERLKNHDERLDGFEQDQRETDARLRLLEITADPRGRRPSRG